MTTVRNRRRGGDGEAGAALVEFALIFPLFMTIVLGMFTGGITYNRDLSINHAAREGARYGATLAKSTGYGVGGLDAAAWTAAVRNRLVQAAAGDIDLTAAGTYVCVALVKSGSSPPTPPPNLVVTDGIGAAYSSLSAPNPAIPTTCFDDGLSDSQPRVHVLVQRPGKIQGLFFSMNLTLKRTGTARYEG